MSLVELEGKAWEIVADLEDAATAAGKSLDQEIAGARALANAIADAIEASKMVR